MNPDAGDLALTAGWGHPGRKGIIMPGSGRVTERERASDEITALREGLELLGIDINTGLELLGHRTCDVYLNERAFWRNVPLGVWTFTLGGYQVLKKWLSYREMDLYGRILTIDEVHEFTNVAHRIAAILLIQPSLDTNYHEVKTAG